jgi:hypothetical protein
MPGLSVRALCKQIMPTLCTYGSLDTWTIVCLIATNFEPFMFPMSGFIFASVSNILIVANLYDFFLRIFVI